MTRADDAAAAAQRLFPPGAEVAACLVGMAPRAFDSEQVAVAHAVPARRAEFAAGRAAVRRALDALGLPPLAVPMAESRAPVWPSGLVGSITHADGLALAAVAPSRQCGALGLDAEPDEPLPMDLLASVTRPEERRWVAAQSDPGRAARMIFVAKEAAYKCQFPLSQSVIGFDAMRIAFGAGGRVEATFTVPVLPFLQGQRLTGHMTVAAGLVLAGFSLSARADTA